LARYEEDISVADIFPAAAAIVAFIVVFVDDTVVGVVVAAGVEATGGDQKILIFIFKFFVIHVNIFTPFTFLSYFFPQLILSSSF